MDVKFLKGSQEEYNSVEKSPYTFYYTVDTHRLYLGEVLLAEEGGYIGTFVGKQATISSSFTPAGSISQISHTPSGEVSIDVEPLQEGEVADYIPSGLISKPNVAVEVDTVTFNAVTSAGTLPSAEWNEGTLPSATFTQGELPEATFNAGTFPVYTLAQGELPTFSAVTREAGTETVLELGWTSGQLPGLNNVAGELPSLSFDKGKLAEFSFKAGALPSLTFNAGTPITYESVTAISGVDASLDSTPVFTGTGVKIKGGFKGDVFEVTPTFTGEAGSATATYTPEGTITISSKNN